MSATRRVSAQRRQDCTEADKCDTHQVVVPFYTACGDCYYCARGQASRCSKGELFGNSVPANTIDGGQAEYVRCPLADSTFVKTPSGIPEEMLVLMADIFPTGYFAASRFLKNLSARDKKEFTAVVVGCGPVGVCAITCALTMVDTVYAIDSVPERLEQAQKLGAKTINLNDNPVQKIKDATEGRGADVVMEVVGHADAFQLCFEMIRPWGCISSIGVQYVPDMSIPNTARVFADMTSFSAALNRSPSTASSATARTSQWRSAAAPCAPSSRKPWPCSCRSRRRSRSCAARR